MMREVIIAKIYSYDKMPAPLSPEEWLGWSINFYWDIPPRQEFLRDKAKDISVSYKNFRFGETTEYWIYISGNLNDIDYMEYVLQGWDTAFVPQMNGRS